MTLRAKVIIVTGMTLVLLMIAVVATSRIILLDSFARLEEESVKNSLSRGQAALFDEIERLNGVAGDWALWDDTYDFVEDANKDYISSNMSDDTFANLRVNLMVFVNLSGRVVYGKAFDLQNEVEIAVPEGLQEHPSASPFPSVLLRHDDARSSVTGILYVSGSDAPLLVASRPIMKSGGKGPIRGTLVVGRFLDSAAIAQIARLTHLKLGISRFDESRLPLSVGSPVLVRPVSNDRVVGYTIVTDIYAKPAMVLEVDISPRDIYQHGQGSLVYINWSLFAVGLVFVAVTVLLWDRLALSRLAHLNTEVSTIGASGDLGRRVQTSGGDELANVAGSINRMLDALQQSNVALQESEARFRRLAENAQDMIFRYRVSPAAGFEYVSPAAVHITGYALDEFYADPELGLRLVHPDDRALFESVLRSPSLLNRSLVLRWVRKDGEVVFIEQHNAPIYDEAGVLVALEGIARDVTERRLAEEALRKSEERFRQQAMELRALYEASLQLGAQLEIPNLLRIITEQAVELLHAKGGGLYLYDPLRKELTLSFAINYLDEWQPVKAGESIIGQTFESRRSMFWPYEQGEPGAEQGARLAVPLLGTDRVLGVLDVIGGESFFGRHEIQFAELFTAQAAVALEKANLHAEVRHHVRELAALNRAGQAILSTLNLQAVLNLVISESRGLLNAEAVSVLLYDQAADELYFAAVDSPGAEQLTGKRMPASQGIAGWVMQHKQAVLSHDAYADPRFSRQIDESTRMTTRSILAVPLMTREAVLGVIEALNKVEGVFEQSDRVTLEAMASSAAIATENARLYQMEKEQRELAETLRKVGATLVSTLDVATVLDRFLEQVSRVVPHETANIMLIEGDHVRIVRRRGYERFGVDLSDVPDSYPIASIPNLQQMIETGEPVVIPDTRLDPNWVRRAKAGDWYCSYAGVPIRVRGRGIGFLNVHSATPGFYSRSDAERLRTFADQAAIALENARLFEGERKTAERLQALSRRLVGAQEMERSRVARELHDEAGQSLASLMVNLRLLEQEAHAPDRVIALAGQLKQITDGILEGLHRLAVDLRPASLDHLGLVAALRQYVETFVRQHNMDVQFEVVRVDGGRMPMEVETALYRIVQEALTNVARHAQATRVDVILERRGDRLVLIIEDNGVGFSLDAAVPGERLGLVGMKERAEMLGGEMEVESEIGRGTTILVEVPYAHSHLDS